MRVLLTGGAGFIGSHVAETLLRERHVVVIVDDLNDFYSPDIKRSNLDEVRRTGEFTFHHADVRDAETMNSVFEAAPPDVVIHLAARAGVRPSLLNPLLYEQVNVQGTITLLEACRKYDVKSFMLGSSSSVYGESHDVPFREDVCVNRPISPYAASKAAAEKICYTYSHLYGINTVCLRFFTVYGPRQRPDLAICKFTDLISRGEPIPVYGDGSTGRDYTYVTDIASGVVSALRLDTPYDIINLGNSHPVTLSALIETIETALGKKAIINRLPTQPGDVSLTFADISRARKLLQYKPGTTFSDGIAEFVRWRLARQ